MNYELINNNVVVHNVTALNLAETLDCGQLNGVILVMLLFDDSELVVNGYLLLNKWAFPYLIIVL